MKDKYQQHFERIARQRCKSLKKRGYRFWRELPANTINEEGPIETPHIDFILEMLRGGPKNEVWRCRS